MKFSQFEDTLSLFNQMMQDALPDVAQHWRPELSITDFEDRFVISCDLPGLSVDDVRLDVGDGVLEISGERTKPILDEGAFVTVNERVYGMFQRKVRLDDSVDTTAIEADFVNGVLTITAPRQEEALSRRISIRDRSATPGTVAVDGSVSVGDSS